MKTIRAPLYAAVALFGACTLWAAVTWYTGIGVSVFVTPGEPLAELVFPVTKEPYLAQSAHSPAEAIAQLVVARGLHRGLQIWWCSVAFWLVVPPLAAFLGVWYVRRHGA